MELPGGADPFRLFVESTEEYALALLDEGGRVTYWNPAAERVTGYTADEMRGHGLDRVLPEDARRRSVYEGALERARDDGVARRVGWRLRKGGEQFHGEGTLTALRQDGRLLGFTWVLREDTREKKEADRQRFLAEAGAVLAESLELTDTFSRIAHLAVPEIADWAVVDVLRDGQLDRVAFAHADPERERVAAELARLYPPLRGHETGVWEVVDTGEGRLVPHIPREMRRALTMTPEHGAVLQQLGFSSWMCVPLAAHGRVLGALSFVMAESGRVFDEDDLSFAEEVGRRAGVTLENAGLYDDARRALKAREEFLAVASHELRTPLTPLRLQLDALSRVLCVDEADVERQRHKIEVMRRQVDRLARLVESLLAVTRGSPIELSAREPADLAEIVGDVVERMEERAYTVETDILFEPEQVVRGRFDARAVEIVIEHLLDNAIKYGEGAPIEVTVQREDDRAVVRVRDRGIGIEEADQERIFEKFERSVSSDHYGGLGLGLFIAKELALAHGGTLRVESERGRGAVFTLELPLEEGRAGGAQGRGR